MPLSCLLGLPGRARTSLGKGNCASSHWFGPDGIFLRFFSHYSPPCSLQVTAQHPPGGSSEATGPAGGSIHRASEPSHRRPPPGAVPSRGDPKPARPAASPPPPPLSLRASPGEAPLTSTSTNPRWQRRKERTRGARWARKPQGPPAGVAESSTAGACLKSPESQANATLVFIISVVVITIAILQKTTFLPDVR